MNMHLSRGRLALAIALGAALLSPTKHASAAPARRQSDAPRMSPIPEDTERPAPAPIQAEPLQLPANADLLDFEAIIRHAQANAPAVQIARSRLELGDAAIAGQKPLLPDNPTVWFGAGVRTNQMGRNLEIQAQIDQRLEIFGERRLRIAAARRARDYLQRELEVVLWRNYAEVHAAYNAAVVARSRAQTAAGLLAFSARLLEISRRRAQAGEISALRARVAEGEFAQAQQAKLAAELDFRLACNRLAEAAGWSKDRVIAPSGELRRPQQVGDPGEMIDRALAEHPQIAARRARVTAAEARLAAARRDRLPEPSVGGFFSREVEPGGPGYRTAVGLATITIPIPLWRRNQGEIAEAKAAISVANAELAATEYQMSLQLRRAAEAVDIAAQRVATYARDVVPRFEENLTMLERAFELGEADIIEVFVARERFLSIQTEALSAYDTYYRSIYELEALTGTTFDRVARDP
jgi:cobalt-zinc-cadmium efflux system outer membrane protein